MSSIASKHNVRTWPKTVRQAIDAIAATFAAAYELTRCRAVCSRSEIIRNLAHRDDAVFEARLLQREAAVLRCNRAGVPARKRPHYSPHDRLEILQITRLRGWSLDQAARRFALHRNTLSAWVRELETRPESSLFTGVIPWNKIGDAVIWLVHDIRTLCPERDFGTRAIAMQIVRAGIQLGRSSVQRYLRGRKPLRPTPDSTRGENQAHRAAVPHRLLRPQTINRVWHLDLTTFEFLWVRFYVAALLDGFSRKLLALRVYADAPNSGHLRRVVADCAAQFGAPRFLITDHGCQFRTRFKRAMKNLGITLVKGCKDSKRFNGKAERFFRTLKLWQRVTLLAASLSSIQRRLETYREWYNTRRPMAVLGACTPQEAWSNSALPRPVPIRARGPQPALRVIRQRCRDDPNLIVLRIQAAKQTA